MFYVVNQQLFLRDDRLHSLVVLAIFLLNNRSRFCIHAAKRCNKHREGKRLQFLVDGLSSEYSDKPVEGNYVPVKLKLQHPPPRANPGHFDCASCLGRGEFERCLGRVGNLNRIYFLFELNMPVSFSLFAGFDAFLREDFAFVSEYRSQNGV